MPRKKPLLTPTMLKILALHASGKTLKEISDEIYVSYSAVTNSMYEARERLGVGSNAALVMRAHSMGYLSHPTGPDLQVLRTQPVDVLPD